MADATPTPAMPQVSAAVMTEWDMALSTIAAGNAATLDIAQAMRGDMPIAENLWHRETAESFADALRSVLALIQRDPPTYKMTDRRGRYRNASRLLVAVQDFLEGWDHDD